MSARYIVGDVFDVLATLPDASVDLVFSSPPFLALRSYLPADHPDKGKEIGSEATPADFLDTLLDVVEACDRVLAPHGSLCFELGDTFSGSGGAGGDYNADGLRDGQQKFDGAAKRMRKVESREHRPEREGTSADGGARMVPVNAGPGWPLDKSLCGIPTLFAWSLAYGRNLLRPERETPRWRIRNLVVWARPNPPVGALGDKFRPATSYLTVATKARARYFDLDAVREPWKPRGDMGEPRAYHSAPEGGYDRSERVLRDTNGGAPPLDYWVIPTAPSDERTGRRVRVELGALAGGIQRTTSPSCPVHGSEDRPGSSGPDGGRGGSGSTHTERNGGRPGRERIAVTPPTPQTLDLLASIGSPADPPAIAHSTASSRTARAPETTSPGTPSARTAADTARTSASPESSAPDGSTPESSTAPGGSDARSSSGTSLRTVDTDGSPGDSACSCSHYVEVDVPEDSSDNAGIPLDWWQIPTAPFRGSHYATFPPELVVKPVKAMCPARVCRVCGEPSRRITRAVHDTEHNVAQREVGTSRGWNEARMDGGSGPFVNAEYETLGWTDCGHNDWRAGHVLDPFGGSGTVGQVATGHGRDCTLIDLDERNADLAMERVGPMLLTVEHLDREGAA